MAIVLLQRKVTRYYDPYIPEIHTEEGRKFFSSELKADFLRSMDVVVFVTNHSVFDVAFIVEEANLVVDLRNAVKFKSDKVYKL